MNRFIFSTIVLFVLVVPSFAGGKSDKLGSETKTYKITVFSEVSIASDFSFAVHQGPVASLVITAPANLFNRIKVEQSGAKLKISRSFGYWNWGSQKERPHADIVVPSLSALSVSGASSGSLLFDTRKTKDFSVKVGGASRLELEILADQLKVDLGGASTLEAKVVSKSIILNISGASKSKGMLESDLCKAQVSGASTLSFLGAATTLNLDVSGASTAKMAEFIAGSVSAIASGASTIHLKTDGPLEAKASGASTIRYLGQPTKLTEDSSGASSIGKM